VKPKYSSKIGRARFDQPEFDPSEPFPVAAKGTAPRLGGQMGRCVRGETGEIVTLSALDGLRPIEVAEGPFAGVSETML